MGRFALESQWYGSTGGDGEVSYADLPHWSVALPTAAVYALVAPSVRRRRHTRRSHRPRCGYDLRATPGRCPECGTAPEHRR